ncbi:MAG: LPS assembly lipoprotein LptE [Bacteroidales bacterium]|jgi:hypothetical protein|nr:LPS assembly lipoprotein LptE [Bacteroidales bacterium]
MRIRVFKYLISLFTIVLSVVSCGIYSFTGTSIAPDVKTINVATIENKAMKVNPSLSNLITNALQDKYRSLTKLEFVDMDPDLEVSGYITDYSVIPTAVTSEEVASKNRLTITVKIKFVNEKHHDEDFEKNFVAYSDYDSTSSLDAVESELCDEIVKTLVENIFNATVANW